MRDNLTLASHRAGPEAGLISSRRSAWAPRSLVDRLPIATPKLEQLTRNLSGGNQQKVVIGRWFATRRQGLHLRRADDRRRRRREGRDLQPDDPSSPRTAPASSSSPRTSKSWSGCATASSVMKKGVVVKEFERGEAGLHEVLQWATGGGRSRSAGRAGRPGRSPLGRSAAAPGERPSSRRRRCRAEPLHATTASREAGGRAGWAGAGALAWHATRHRRHGHRRPQFSAPTTSSSSSSRAASSR